MGTNGQGTGGRRGRALWGALGLLAWCVTAVAAAEPGAAGKVPIPGQAAACAACHPGQAKGWATTLHRRTVGAPQVPAARQGCTACHETAAAHLADVTDKAKRPSLAGYSGEQIAALCQSCHRGGKQTFWRQSAHAGTKQGCLTCHDPHQGQGEAMLREEEPALCARCHPTQVAENKLPSHHPIPEGKMVCTDCHNVHGDERGNLPESSTAEICYRCHAEKAGPFLNEHPPVTEDCATCHRPHGSPVDNLLIQDQPLLCLQCHTGHHDAHRSPLVSVSADAAGAAQGAEAIVGFYGKCTSCHSRIHGTDLPSGSGSSTFMPGRPLAAEQQTASAHRAADDAPLDYSMFGFSMLDIGGLEQHGNPNYVREYDGRDYSTPSLALDLQRFGQHDDFRLRAQDLMHGDQEVKVRLGNPLYDLQVRQSGLTHRLGRYDDIPDALVIAAQRGGTQPLYVTDLAEGKDDYRIRRQLWDVHFAARYPKLPSVKWLANFWRESERGERQFLFLDRCAGCHKIQTTEPIDRVTSVSEAGLELALGRGVLRYLHGEQKFTSDAPEQFYHFSGAGSMFNGDAPLFGVADNKATSDDVRAAAPLGRNISASALYRTKRRDNLLGHGKLRIRSTGGGFDWLLTRGLHLDAGVSSRSFDVERVPEGTSRDISTSRLDLRYTGLAHAIMSLGFTRESVDRTTGEEEREFVPRSSDSDTWRAALTYQPTARAWLSLRYRNTSTDNRDFFDLASPPEHFPSRLLGAPDKSTLFSGVASYNLADHTLVSLLYSQRRDDYNVSVPALDVDRQARDRVTTSGAQISHDAGRLHVGGGYYRQRGNTFADVTYGVDDFTAVPPLSTETLVFPPIEGTAAYRYAAAIQLLDADYRASRRFRLFGRLARTTTDGRITAYDLGDYLDQNPDLDGVALTLNPFDVTIWDRWLGVGYLVDPATEVVLSLQRRSWEDKALSAHDGSFSVWRLGVRKSF